MYPNIFAKQKVFWGTCARDSALAGLGKIFTSENFEICFASSLITKQIRPTSRFSGIGQNFHISYVKILNGTKEKILITFEPYFY